MVNWADVTVSQHPTPNGVTIGSAVLAYTAEISQCFQWGGIAHFN